MSNLTESAPSVPETRNIKTALDFRSDTVTRPTPEMRRAMAEAVVGDDVYGEDPTINRLEERAAQIFGREASIFLNSSSVDNTPNAILEAFAAGLPVVTTAPGGIPYLVEHDRNGLLVPLDDSAAIAREALRLLDDPDLAAALVRNAHDAVQRFSWPNLFRLLQAIYSPWPTPAAADTSQGIRP